MRVSESGEVARVLMNDIRFERKSYTLTSRLKYDSAVPVAEYSENRVSL